MNILKRWLIKRSLRESLERLEKSGMLDGIKKIFGSKKAVAVVAGIALVVFRDGLGLDAKFADELVKLILAYLGTQGVVDAVLAAKGNKVQ